MQDEQHPSERQDHVHFYILALFPLQLNKSALKLASLNTVGVAESDISEHGHLVPIHGCLCTTKASPCRR